MNAPVGSIAGIQTTFFDTRTTYHIFGDESSQTKGPGNRFMVVGGLLTSAATLQAFDERMKALRQELDLSTEIKWTKVSARKANDYKRFIDEFFRFNAGGQMQFAAMILEHSKIDHRRYNKTYPNFGKDKFYYQLLLHKFGARFLNDNLKVWLDARTTACAPPLEDLRSALNIALGSTVGQTIQPFRSIERAQSHSHDAMQIVDVIIGAIAYRKNAHHLMVDANETKRSLSEHILQMGRIPKLRNTDKTETKFQLWNFQPLK